MADFGERLSQLIDDHRLVEELVRRARAAQQVLLETERAVLTGPRHGRIYRRPGGGTYQASAPGEPPAERTSRLRFGWRPYSRVERATPGVVSLAVGIATDVPYAGYLDRIGGGSGYLNRPFVQRIRQRAAKPIAAIFREPFLR